MKHLRDKYYLHLYDLLDLPPDCCFAWAIHETFFRTLDEVWHVDFEELKKQYTFMVVTFFDKNKI